MKMRCLEAPHSLQIRHRRGTLGGAGSCGLKGEDEKPQDTARSLERFPGPRARCEGTLKAQGWTLLHLEGIPTIPIRAQASFTPGKGPGQPLPSVLSMGIMNAVEHEQIIITGGMKLQSRQVGHRQGPTVPETPHFHLAIREPIALRPSHLDNHLTLS